MRAAQDIMVELAGAGLSPTQLALVMELSAAVATEARPARDEAAENKRAYDREYRRTHRTKSYDNNDKRDPSPNERDNLTPTRERKTEPKGSSKSLVGEEKRQPVVSCIRRAYPPPEGVTDEQWLAFRTQRKKPLNERSYTLVCNKLIELAEAGWPPGDMIDRAIEHGWETVFKPRNFGNERDSNPLATAVQRLAAHQ